MEVSESEVVEDPNIMEESNATFIVLLKTFEYLGVLDLLRASRVSKLWNFVASHNVLWRAVNLNHCRLRNLKYFGHKLQKHGTQVLNLEQVSYYDHHDVGYEYRLYPTPKTYWKSLFKTLKSVKTLKKVSLGTCNPGILTQIADVLPNVISFSSHVNCGPLNITSLSKIKNLQELTLNGQITLFIKNVEYFQRLENLISLNVGNVKNLDELVKYLPVSLLSLKLGYSSGSDKIGLHYLDMSPLCKLTQIRDLTLVNIESDGVFLRNMDFFRSLISLTSLKLENFFRMDLLGYLPSSLLSLELEWNVIEENNWRNVDLGSISNLSGLSKLMLVSNSIGVNLINLSSFFSLRSLTSLIIKGKMNLDTIVNFLPSSLVSLELGNCFTLTSSDFPTKIIPTLVNLENVRFCDGFGAFPTTEVVNAVSAMPNISCLELHNVIIKEGFKEALASCKNLQKLLISPYYNGTCSALSVHKNIFIYVIKLKYSLKHFILGYDSKFISLRKYISFIKESFYNPDDSDNLLYICHCKSRPNDNQVHFVPFKIAEFNNNIIEVFLPQTKVNIIYYN